ncbi:hypothetical protein L596_028407 [Steinernema carpocapsae]|uniref:Uncharacterized protein n=1 Tax=Steinernema carpocapsae TaxID=34508 RepID=A0A4U5LYE4_STECR|nr:hypothetical protein L596_028407 [Steinernema carpocapsae]
MRSLGFPSTSVFRTVLALSARLITKAFGLLGLQEQVFSAGLAGSLTFNSRESPSLNVRYSPPEITKPENIKTEAEKNFQIHLKPQIAS